jgi:hypothetical protein
MLTLRCGRTAAGGFRVRGKRDSWAGAEPPDQIPVGANGSVRQKSHAVPQRGALRGERGGWQGDSIRPVKIEMESKMNSVVVITATIKG